MTVLAMILYAPFMLAAWAAPFASQSWRLFAAIAGGVWVPLIIGYISFENFIERGYREYWIQTWWGILIVLCLPLLYAFSVGVLGQFLALAFTRRGSDQEGLVRVLSLLLMVGVPMWFFL
jgi:phosphotransferase system  glucose/maltose/N-acetylglucosamine-specific IIC component